MIYAWQDTVYFNVFTFVFIQLKSFSAFAYLHYVFVYACMCLRNFLGALPACLSSCQSQRDDWSGHLSILLQGFNFTKEAKWDRRCKKTCKAMKESACNVAVACLLNDKTV